MVHDIEDPRSGTAGLRVKKYFKFSHPLVPSLPLTLSRRVLAELGPGYRKFAQTPGQLTSVDGAWQIPARR